MQSTKPVSNSRAAQPKTAQGLRNKPPSNPKNSQLTVEAKNMPMVKAPAKDTEKKSTTVKVFCVHKFGDYLIRLFLYEAPVSEESYSYVAKSCCMLKWASYWTTVVT